LISSSSAQIVLALISAAAAYIFTCTWRQKTSVIYPGFLFGVAARIAGLLWSSA
jgi:hypothetical protein